MVLTIEDVASVERGRDKLDTPSVFLFDKEEDVHRAHFRDIVLIAEQPQHLQPKRK